MVKRNRVLYLVFAAVLLVSFVIQSYGFQATKNSGLKAIVGKWAGDATQDGTSDVLQVKLDLRLDGSRIVGDVQSQAGEMKVTNVSYANGKWAISLVSADG